MCDADSNVSRSTRPMHLLKGSCVVGPYVRYWQIALWPHCASLVALSTAWSPLSVWDTNLDVQAGAQLMKVDARIADYLLSFLLVLGIPELRSPHIGTGYKTWRRIPFIFSTLSRFRSLRSSVTDPMQSGGITSFSGFGWVVFNVEANWSLRI